MIYRLIPILLSILFIIPSYGAHDDSAAVTTYSTADGMSHDRIQGFYQTADGMMWVCTWYGIDRFDGYRFDSFRPPKELNADSRFKEVSAVGDTLFIRTINGTSLSFDTKSCRYGISSDPVSNKGLKLGRNFTDSEGNSWSASPGGIQLTVTSPGNYDIIKNRSYTYARAIYEDTGGNIWVGWCNDAINGKADGEVVIYGTDGNPIRTLALGTAIYSIFEDKDRNIWLGTRDNGLVILKHDSTGNQQQYTYNADGTPGSLSHNAVFDITQDDCGRIWIATLGGGLDVVESGYDISKLSFHTPEGYPKGRHPRARTMLVNDSLMLAGTDTGLLQARLSDDTDGIKFIPVKYTGKSFPAEEIIHLIHENGDTVLISSFGKGIYRYTCADGSTFPLAADDIADRQPVFSALPDGKNRLWVVSRTAIMLYTIHGQHDTFITPVNRTLTLLETQPLRDSKGQSWFAASEGLVRVLAPDDSTADSSRKVIFTHITRFRNDSTTTDILTGADSVIILEPDTRDISLNVSSMPFGNPDGVKYAWRVTGRDSTWTETDGKHSLTLTDLRTGIINLEVRSTDIYGRYLDNTGHIRIYVKPHWYELTVVKTVIWVAGIIILAALLLFIIRYRRLSIIYDSVINSQPVARMSAAMTEIKDTDALTASDREFLDAINAHIEKSLGNSEFSIDDLVESIGMSRSVFYRRLKAVVGQSPSEYINKYRLSRAASMLHDDPEKPVSSVAYECGFSSPQYFSNLFRKRYQMTPNEWRKNGH